MANEKRLIDANAFIKYFERAKEIVKLIPGELGNILSDLYDEVIEEIKKQHTVYAVEVVHGKWEKAEYNGFLRCDQCKDVYINEEWLEDGKWNYCPNCGANMKGE